VCDYIDNLTDLITGDDTTCFMRDYKLWVEAGNSSTNNSVFPAIFSSTNQTYQKEQFVNDLIEFVMEDDTGAMLNTVNSIGLNWLSQDLMFASIRWTGTISRAHGLLENEALIRRWDEVFAEVNTQSPFPDSEVGMWTCYEVLWTQCRRALIEGLIYGLGITSIIAFFALLFSTGNWIISLFAVFCILGIMMSLGMFTVLVGYDIGLVESLVGPVVIGFTVDYTVHLCVGYLQSSMFNTREERATMALTDLSVGIAFGGLTTLMCTLPMCLGVIVQMYKFGILVSVTVIFGEIWALVFLSSMLISFGPEGNDGNISAIYYIFRCKPCRNRCRKPRRKKIAMMLELM